MQMHKTQLQVNCRTKKIAIGLAKVICLITTVVLFTANITEAYSSYTASFNAEYGTAGTNGGSTLGSCITCHVNTNGTGGYNSYGTDWKPGKN